MYALPNVKKYSLHTTWVGDGYEPFIGPNEGQSLLWM
jgi:hypothetical protein